MIKFQKDGKKMEGCNRNGIDKYQNFRKPKEENGNPFS
jgi:hypothetical protein